MLQSKSKQRLASSMSAFRQSSRKSPSMFAYLPKRLTVTRFTLANTGRWLRKIACIHLLTLGSAQKLGKAQAVTFEARLTSANQCINVYVACEEIGEFGMRKQCRMIMLTCAKRGHCNKLRLSQVYLPRHFPSTKTLLRQ